MQRISMFASRQSHFKRGISTLCIATAVGMLAASGSLHAQNLTYTTFVSSSSLFNLLGQNATIGFAYAGNKFVGSVYNGTNNSQLYAVDLDGTNIRKFGTLLPSSSGEIYVSSSLGLGGFVSRNVFAGSEAAGTLFQISNDGTTVTTFATGLVGGVRSIAFDPYGLYGFDMIVATNQGKVYRVNAAGTATLLATLGEDAEGLSFAPQDIGPMLKGTLVVASEGSGSLRAIGPAGAFSTFATVASAEMVSFVPLNLGQSGNPVEGFYAANFATDIQRVSYQQFLPFLGDIIVTGETNHVVSRLHWDGASWVKSDFTNQFPGQPEDGIFVTTDVINPIPTTAPEPMTMAMLLPALLVVGGIARRRRDR
ncbi:MAG: hypothetical protein ABJB66_12440 [Gemmatimonadaceae bacterium]